MGLKYIASENTTTGNSSIFFTGGYQTDTTTYGADWNPTDPTIKCYDDWIEEKNKNKKEGVDTMYLYKVWLVYGGDRDDVSVSSAQNHVVAKDEEDAKIKSGIYKDIPKDWDSDYITIICQCIGDVNVKSKAKEVKHIK